MPQVDIMTTLNLGPSSLARQRLVWASRPMGFLLLALWVLHPSTASHTDYVHMSLIAFLVGVFYGCVVYGAGLREYIAQPDKNHRHKPNRVPEEYYWGNITKTMFDNTRG